MNGQTKNLILALVGIVTLLLAGVVGINLPRVKQATSIAETRAVTMEDYRHQTLGNAFRAGADAAVREMSQSIAADLTVELKHLPSVVVAQNAASYRERS
jgi:hypothetical protein